MTEVFALEPMEPYNVFSFHDFAPAFEQDGDIVREYSADADFPMPYDGYYYANFWLDMRPMD